MQTPVAVYTEALKELRRASRELTRLGKTVAILSKKLRANPPAMVVTIYTLPGDTFRLRYPVRVSVEASSKSAFARFVEADLEAGAKTVDAAVAAFRDLMVRTFVRLRAREELSPEDRQQLRILADLIEVADGPAAPTP
jgi:hypothetical protein